MQVCRTARARAATVGAGRPHGGADVVEWCRWWAWLLMLLTDYAPGGVCSVPQERSRNRVGSGAGGIGEPNWVSKRTEAVLARFSCNRLRLVGSWMSVANPSGSTTQVPMIMVVNAIVSLFSVQNGATAPGSRGDTDTRS